MTATPLQISTEWERPALTAREGSATLMIRIAAPSGKPAAGSRPPLDIAFVIDRSGSMSGHPLELARKAVSHAVGSLDDRDRATLVAFDDQIDLVHRLFAMTSKSRNELRMALARIDSRGSTNLCAGWLTGCRELARNEKPEGPTRVRRAILLTDGRANQGETDSSVICDHATELRQRSITTTTLGMGHDFDEQLLSAMAEAGGGNFVFVESAAQLPRVFEREMGRLSAITAARINLRLRLPEGLHGELLNPFPVERNGHRFDVSIDDLSSGDEVVLIFDVTGRDLMPGARLPFELSLRWTDPATSLRATESVPVEPVDAVDERTYRSIPASDDVAAQAALVRASAAQRRAMELDRAGRFAESRALHADARDLLFAAPLPAEHAHLRDEARSYAAYDANASFTEHDRKQATHNAVNRTRRKQSTP